MKCNSLNRQIIQLISCGFCVTKGFTPAYPNHRLTLFPTSKQIPIIIITFSSQFTITQYQKHLNQQHRLYNSCRMRNDI